MLIKRDIWFYIFEIFITIGFGIVSIMLINEIANNKDEIKKLNNRINEIECNRVYNGK